MSALVARLRAWSTARHLAQLGIVLALVWLIFIGTDYLTAGSAGQMLSAGVRSNVAAFGLLFATVFHFFGRDRVSLVVIAITLVALGWFTLTVGTNLPGWMSLDFLFRS